MGRSFKYHRPRGPLSAGSEEPNAIVELRTGARQEPNTRATVAELFDGLEANSQNRFPSLKLDLMGINDRLSPFFAAGFYYKTFMWPAAFWEKLYEPIIRRAAGLGTLNREEDPDAYDKGFLHCDILIIGAGPAGLMAALTAGRAGARVILADEDFRMGGRLNAETLTIGNHAGADWAEDTVRTLHQMRAPLAFGFPLANGWSTFPGYGMGRESQAGFLNIQPQPNPKEQPALGQPCATVRFGILKDPGFNLVDFEPRRFQAQLQAASALIDSTNLDLSRFFARGGRLIIKTSASDYGSHPQIMMMYYDAMVARLGQAAPGAHPHPGAGAQCGLPAAFLLSALNLELAGYRQGGVPRSRQHRLRI